MAIVLENPFVYDIRPFVRMTGGLEIHLHLERIFFQDIGVNEPSWFASGALFLEEGACALYAYLITYHFGVVVVKTAQILSSFRTLMSRSACAATILLLRTETKKKYGSQRATQLVDV